MSQLRYTRGTLYIRRAKKGDTIDSMIGAYQMAAHKILNAKRGKRYYFVAVRRGFPHQVVASARSRTELKEMFHGRPWRDTQLWFRCAKRAV